MVTGHYDAGLRIYEAPAPDEHDGIDGLEADRRARLLTKHAASSGIWQHLPEHLTRLRQIVADAKDGP